MAIYCVAHRSGSYGYLHSSRLVYRQNNLPKTTIYLVPDALGIPDDENADNRWAVDHLFVDQDAIPTLVEVKRSTDTRIRREVVGQILDYAANAALFWPIERLIVQF